MLFKQSLKYEIPYLSFLSSKINLTLSTEFTLPSCFLPIIIARRCERFTHHVLNKFINKVILFFCIGL